MALGNAYHGKLDIYFQTADGKPPRVHHRVGQPTDEHLTPKVGRQLPLRAVTGFDFY